VSEKPLGAQRAITLYPCCVSLQDPRGLIYARVEPIIDPLLPQKQAGFRHGWSTVDQDTLLTQEIEDSCSAKKVGAVFIGLTAAYHTVCHRGLTCKLLRLLPNSHMVCMLMELLGKFQLHPYHRQRKTQQVTTPQEQRPTGIFAPLIFNVYCTSLNCQTPFPERMHMLTT